MPNSPSQMIPDMLDWRQIRGSGRPRIVPSSSAETVLRYACFQFPPTFLHSKRSHRWLGIKGSTRNGHRDNKRPSVRRLLMVREDTGAPNEDATCAWIAADEAVGCTRAFLTIWWSFR
ncbi:uncharacterized protein TNCV_3576051 [Trichonephila clavipes]|nr:uncharacterized protein TNCV_3576051 [Trichonephila clavipes]